MPAPVRIILIALVLCILSVAHSFAVNQVRVFVPPQNGFAAQQLQLGLPGDIYVEITNDIPILGCEIPIEFTSESGSALWPIITDDDVAWEEEVLFNVVSPAWQDGLWPDTIVFLALFSIDQQPLPAGTTTIFKITVIPTELGTVHLAPRSFTDSITSVHHEVQFNDVNTVNLPASFIGLDIEIVLPDCNQNGIPDDTDILNETSLDCNNNGIPDECDISYGLEPDCNLSGLLDSCDVASGFSLDINTNYIPDDCETLTDSNFVMFHVPASNGLARQELWVGQPQDIYLQINTTNELTVVELPVIINSLDGTRLFEPITEDDVTLLATPAGYSNMSVFTRTGGANWPDTTTIVWVGSVLPVGTYDLLKITVTPLTTGRITFDPATFHNGAIQLDGPVFYFNGSDDSLKATFYAPDITINYFDCNLNQVVDLLDIAYGTSTDCNSNLVPDECEADCNQNGRPDDCDIVDGVSLDLNDNAVPDECEGEVSGSKIRVYVPASNGHAPQQLVLGQTEEIFIEISLDRDDITAIEIPLTIEKAGGGNLWNSLVVEDITFLPASDVLSHYAPISHVHHQDGISSDSLLMVLLGNTAAPAGTADWIKITVVPTEIGVLSFSASTYVDGEIPRVLGFHYGGDPVIPQFIAEEITVIAERAGGGCCLDGYSGNTDCDPDARRNLTDITRLIDNVYLSKTPLCCVDEGNIDGDQDGRVNLADITALIDHVYIGRNPTANCQ